jgi:hypothetical protein
MKALFAALVTLAAVSSAHALESHYGKLTTRGFKYTCTLKNKSNHTMDMKYVDFAFTRVGGHGDNTFNVTQRIDQRVRSGETASYTVSANNVQTADHCRFIAR